MSVAAATLALARPFEWEGAVHRLRPLDYSDLAQFSLWLEERAKAAAFRAIAAGDADAKTIYGAFLDRVAAGAYEPGSEIFDLATRSNSGSRKLLELMLVPPDAETAAEKWRQTTSWEIYADPKWFEAASLKMQEVNSDPLAIRGRRIPAPQAIPSR